MSLFKQSLETFSETISKYDRGVVDVPLGGGFYQFIKQLILTKKPAKTCIISGGHRYFENYIQVLKTLGYRKKTDTKHASQIILKRNRNKDDIEGFDQEITIITFFKYNKIPEQKSFDLTILCCCGDEQSRLITSKLDKWWDFKTEWVVNNTMVALNLLHSAQVYIHTTLVLQGFETKKFNLLSNETNTQLDE